MAPRSVRLARHAAALMMAFAIAGLVQAQCYEPLGSDLMKPVKNIKEFLEKISYPIGFFMIVYMGIKWIISEGPEDRENARRGVIYVVIGLILLKSAVELVTYLLC